MKKGVEKEVTVINYLLTRKTGGKAFYNSVRPHSGIGWIAPNALEASLLNNFDICKRNTA